jgi:acetyl-CoA carboxylase alpha subunit
VSFGWTDRYTESRHAPTMAQEQHIRAADLLEIGAVQCVIAEDAFQSTPRLVAEIVTRVTDSLRQQARCPLGV